MNIFHMLVGHLYSDFWELSAHFISLLLIRLFDFLIFKLWFLHILDINLMSNVYFTKIFSYSFDFLFAQFSPCSTDVS